MANRLAGITSPSVSTTGLAPGRAIDEILAAIDSEIVRHRNLRKVLEVLDSSREDLLVHFVDLLGSEIAGKALTLKILNLCLAKYHYRAQSTSTLARPFGLILDPSNFCNLQCPGCVHSPTAKHHFQWGGATMSVDQFGSFATRYAPFATHIMLCNYGEPLLNKHTPAFIRLAKSYLLRASLSTSLSVGKVNTEEYVSSGLDFMIMSIDGATQPVYQQYRRNGNIDYVYENIRNLVESRRRLGSGTPILHWQFLAFEHNEHEIPLAIERAHELGVDQIQIVTPNDVSWDVPHIKPSAAESRLISFSRTVEERLRRNVRGYEDASASETISREFDSPWSPLADGVDFGSPGYEPAMPSDHTCRWIYTNMTVDATGRVIPCCAAPSFSFDLDYGKIGPDTDAFNSEKYQLSRRYFADPSAWAAKKELRVLNQDPHCVNCKWDQDHTNVTNEHVRQYLTSLGHGFPGAAAMKVLCDW